MTTENNAAPSGLTDDLRRSIVSLELTATWLDGGCDPLRAAAEIRSVLDRLRAVLAAAPKAAEQAPALQAEIDRLNAIINTPQSDDFLRAVSVEAEHQRQRWGNDHDAGKQASDWFWLVGHLAGKAVHAQCAGNVEKAEHHVITSAAALANWHRALFGKTNMRPGIDGDAALQSRSEGEA